MFSVGLIGGAGAAPVVPVQYVGAAISSVQSSGGAITRALPAGVATGDLLVAVLSVGHTTNYNMALTSSFWTRQADLYTLDDQGIHGVNMAVFTKFREAGETSVAATGLSASSHTFLSVAAYRNVHATSPFDTTFFSQSDMFSSIISSAIGAVTPIRQGAMAVGGGMSSSFFTSGSYTSTLTPRPPMEAEVGSQLQAANGIVTGQATSHALWSGSGSMNGTLFDDAYFQGNYGCSARFFVVLRPAGT